MAYAQSAVTLTAYTIQQRKYLRVSFTETGVTTATDGTADALLALGVDGPCSILSVKATKTSGDGATINPRIGYTSGFVVSTQNHVATCTATAAHVHEQGQTYFVGPTLYWRSLPASGTNNAVSVELIIAVGAP